MICPNCYAINSDKASECVTCKKSLRFDFAKILEEARKKGTSEKKVDAFWEGFGK